MKIVVYYKEDSGNVPDPEVIYAPSSGFAVRKSGGQLIINIPGSATVMDRAEDIDRLEVKP